MVKFVSVESPGVDQNGVLIDARALIQEALDQVAAAGGGEVSLPSPSYLVGKGIGDWNLVIGDNVSLVGQGVARPILTQDANMPANVKLLYVLGSRVTIKNLNLRSVPQNDGAKPDEHRSGIFGVGEYLR